MKKNLLFGFAGILIMFGMSGCCKVYWPEKIVFTPEVKMQIDKEIDRLNLKNPAILVVGQEGKTFAVTQDGETYKPCRPPQEQYDKKTRTPYNKKLPVCRGMEDIQRVLDTNPLTIMDTKKNPYCRIVRDPYGGYQERCYP